MMNRRNFAGNIEGPLLRPAAAAEYLGISISGFYAHVANGLLPPLIKIGPRAAGVPKSCLDHFIAEKTSIAMSHLDARK